MMVAKGKDSIGSVEVAGVIIKILSCEIFLCRVSEANRLGMRKWRDSFESTPFWIPSRRDTHRTAALHQNSTRGD